MHVGPQSAGAKPGPVCYALGGERADRDRRQPGARPARGRPVPRRRHAARRRRPRGARSRERIAAPLGLALEAAADGIVRIAVAAMANVVKRVTTERGLDAREFPMVSYGGAGPLHAVLGRARAADQARDRAERARALLGVRHAGRRSAARLRAHPLRTARGRAVRALRPDPRRDGGRPVAPRSAPPRPRRSAIEIRHGADMRYVGQEHAVSVDAAGRALPCARRRRHQGGVRRRARGALRLRVRGRVGGDREPPLLGHRRDAEARARAHRRGRRRARSATRGPANGRSTSPPKGFVPTRRVRPPAAQGGQPHRRAGARRGIRLHHRGAAGRECSRSTPTATCSIEVYAS